MARVTAAGLRQLARDAMLACGGRGFVRFADGGDALLVTDALRRMPDSAQLVRAMEAAGFSCREQDGLLLITPGDGLLHAAAFPGGVADWQSPLHPAQSLALRWAAHERQAFTPAGRALVLDTLRLTWQPPDRVLRGLAALRAQAAVMQRSGDFSGLGEAASVLMHWCMEQEENGYEA